MGGQRHAPAALPPGKKPGTHCIGGWVGPRTGLEVCGKSCPPPGFDHRTVQPVASRYTDWVIATHNGYTIQEQICDVCLIQLTVIEIAGHTVPNRGRRRDTARRYVDQVKDGNEAPEAKRPKHWQGEQKKLGTKKPVINGKHIYSEDCGSMILCPYQTTLRQKHNSLCYSHWTCPSFLP